MAVLSYSMLGVLFVSYLFDHALCFLQNRLIVVLLVCDTVTVEDEADVIITLITVTITIVSSGVCGGISVRSQFT